MYSLKVQVLTTMPYPFPRQGESSKESYMQMETGCLGRLQARTWKTGIAEHPALRCGHELCNSKNS